MPQLLPLYFGNPWGTTPELDSVCNVYLNSPSGFGTFSLAYLIKKNCPQLHAEPYARVAHTSVRPAEATKFCLFCGVAIALARMRNHMAVHLQRGEVVVDPKMRGEAEPCGFCGGSTGTCTTSIVRKKISSTCPFVVMLKPIVAMRKQENMPRKCSIPAILWVLNIKTHLARCHPTVPPNS